MKFWTNWRQDVAKRKAIKRAARQAFLVKRQQQNDRRWAATAALIDQRKVSGSMSYSLTQSRTAWRTNFTNALSIAFENDPRWMHIDSDARNELVTQCLKSFFNGSLAPKWDDDSTYIGAGYFASSWVRHMIDMIRDTDKRLDKMISEQIQRLTEVPE